MSKKKSSKLTLEVPENPEVIVDLTGASVEEKVRHFSSSEEQKSPNPSPRPKMEQQALAEIEKSLLEEAETKLNDAVKSPTFVEDDVAYLWAHYKRVYKVYFELMAKVLDSYQKTGKEKEYIETKRELNGRERDWFMWERAVTKLLEPKVEVMKEERVLGARNNSVQEGGIRMILPKRQLPKFTGEIREWLSFSASFEEIHDDESLSDTDKFHFLIQSTVDGSPARKLLQSFPFSAQNYKAAVKALQDRYGRNTTLVKVYVRDLLQLVIRASTGQKIDLCDLVTSITSQIRNLDTLGVTHDKCSLVLYPVVESCLPVEVLQAWQRHPSYKEDLEELLEFLQREVNSQTDRDLAHFSLGSSKVSGDKFNRNPNSGMRKKFGGDVPTASSFVSGTSSGYYQGGNRGERYSERSLCVFCDNPHSSLTCFVSHRMSLDAKRSILQEKRLCFTCFKKGHLAADCSSNPKCKFCRGKHYSFMCDGRTNSKGVNSTNSTAVPEKDISTSSDENAEQLANLANNLGSLEVPMQTLVVTIHGTNKSC